MKKSLISKLAICLLLFLCLVSCLERDEGCLDPNALNLDVTADVNANCQYPALRLNVSHRWIRTAENDTLNFRLGDRYAFGPDTIEFTSFQYFVSNLRLGDAPSLTVFDSVITYDDLYVRDDLTLVSPALFQFETGHISQFGVFEGIELGIGFDEQWYDVDTIELQDDESTHPWFNSSMYGKMSARYTSQLSYTLYTDNLDTIRRSFGLVTSDPMLVNKDGFFQVNQANNADIGLFIDYRYLLNSVDLKSPDSIGIMEQILENMDAGIHIINE